MSQEAIREENGFPTKVVDYLKFDIYDHKSDRTTDFGPIYLYLPQALGEGYSVAYNTVQLGGIGRAALDAGSDAFKTGAIGDSFSETVKQAAETGKSAMAFSAGAKIINSAIGFSGVGDGSLTTNDVSALVDKRIFNPYEEAIFKGQDKFRDHKFQFRLVPRNSQDVQSIYDIVSNLRQCMLPGRSGNNRWLTIPEYFRISIIRYTDSGEQETISNPRTGGKMGILNKLMQFPTKLVLTNMNLNFAPEGGYSSLQSWNPGARTDDFGPSAYNMDLSFQETAFVTKESFK